MAGEGAGLEQLLGRAIPQVEAALLSRLSPRDHGSLALSCRPGLALVRRRVWRELPAGRSALARALRKRYPVQYGLGPEGAPLALDLGPLGRVMGCVAGGDLLLLQASDPEGEDMVVVYGLSSGSLLGSFSPAREPLVGGGAVVTQAGSGRLEVRTAGDLALLGGLEDLRRRSHYCPAPHLPLLAVYGMVEDGEVVGETVLRLHGLEPGLPLLRSLQPVLPAAAVVTALFYDGAACCLLWNTDQGPEVDWWDIGLELEELEGEQAVRQQTRTHGLQLYTGLERAGEEVQVTNVFLPTCHALALHGRLLTTVSVAARGDRVTLLHLDTRRTVTRTFQWKAFRAVSLQDGVIALRESTLDTLLLFDLEDFLDPALDTESLARREVTVGWQKLGGFDCRTGWLLEGGRVLGHREGQRLLVRDFRRREEQGAGPDL